MLVSHACFVLAFALAVIAAAVTWGAGTPRRRGDIVAALLLLLLTGLGVLWVTAFVLSDVD